MTAIRFVPPAEIERIRHGLNDRYRRAAVIADTTRLNALSMIAYAG